MTMPSYYTKHACDRAQQRGIPPFIEELLDRFGEEKYVGRGAVCLSFSKRRIRDMESQLGGDIVRRLADYLNVYKIVSNNGRVITVGHRTRRQRGK